MKSRRLTVFCVAVIALVGTPRAWQEVSKLIAAVQHKAQVKFWSMVMEPGERQSGEAQLVAAAQPFVSDAAGVPAANCPLNGAQPQEKRVRANSRMANSRTDSVRLQTRAREQQPAAPASHAELMAATPRAVIEPADAEHLYYFKKAPAAPAPPSVAKGPLAPPTVIGGVPPEAVASSKGESYRMVMIPVTDPAAIALFAKENVAQWKLLKKLEENKSMRQKVRLSVGRASVVTTALPAS